MTLVFRWVWWLIAIGQAYNLGTSQTLDALSDTYQTSGFAPVALVTSIIAALCMDYADHWTTA